MCPNSWLFRYFHFRLTFESSQELGSTSCTCFYIFHPSKPLSFMTHPMPSANLVDAYSSSLKVLVFFGFISTKVEKTTKQNKTNLFTNTKKKKGKIVRKTIVALKKEKKGEPKSPFYQSLAMVPTCAQKQQKTKTKKGSSSFPFVETW